MSFYEICLLFALGWVTMRIIFKTNNLAPKRFILKFILKLLLAWSIGWLIIYSYLLKKELEYEKVVVDMTRDEIFEHKQTMDAIYSDFEETQEELRDAYIEIQSLISITSAGFSFFLRSILPTACSIFPFGEANINVSKAGLS